MTILKLKKDKQSGDAETSAQLQAQAEELGRIYPGFDLEREMENSRFAALVQAGATLRDAYEVVHLEELAQAAALREKEIIRLEITEAIRARALRVQENGISAHCAISLRQDVSRLSREQRADYAARAAKGEEITFKR